MYDFEEYLKGKEEFLKEFENREITNLEKIWLAFDLQNYQKFKEFLNNLSKDEYDIFTSQIHQLNERKLLTISQQNMLKIAWKKRKFN